MAGRGDNNKSGSSGRGASNQSNQGMANQPLVKSPIVENKQAARNLNPNAKPKISLRTEIPDRMNRRMVVYSNSSVLPFGRTLFLDGTGIDSLP